MRIILIVLLLQLILNILLDKTGISKRYFTSSGMFVYVVCIAVWIPLSLFISSDLFPGFFENDFVWITMWLPWLITLVIGPVLLLLTQLLYSYLIKRWIVKN
ncbi:MAG: hypothetical protein JWP12_1929 [Bacteroidetes bacterium]|nr:hypothetical protein [Bacteroidota bacterium]